MNHVNLIGKVSSIPKVVELANGRKITGPGFTILFKDMPVDYYCFEKVTDQFIKCYIKPYPIFNKEHEKLIIDTVTKQIGEEILFELIYSEKIFLSKNGKRIYFKTKHQ